MASPASLDRLAESLRSPDPAVRRAAMPHVAAHGARARALAPTIAALLADPDEAVRWHVPRTMRAIARDDEASVPVLLDLIATANGDAMRITRALDCLGAIGPAAGAAIPMLLERARGADPRDAIEAIAQIAERPDDTIASVVIDALFSPEWGTSSAVARVLPEAAPWLRARAIAEAGARLDRAPESAIGIAIELAPTTPEATALAARALAGGRATALAAMALERSTGPIDEATSHTLIELAAQGDDAIARSIRTLAPRLSAHRDRARAVLVPALRLSPSIERRAAIATALAALAPRTSEVVPDLVAALRDGLGDRPSWYRLGALARALGALSDRSHADDVGTVLSEASARAARSRSGDSAVLDFQRALADAAASLAEVSDRRADAPAVRDDGDEELDEGLPEIPEAQPPPPPARLAAVPRAERAAIRRALESGALRTTDPDRVAAHVDRTVRAMRRARRIDDHAIPRLGALYGDAIARALGWRWMLWEQDGDRALALVAPRDTHVLMPFRMVRAALTSKREVTLLLTLRLLRERLPPASDGALARIG